jgi:photosystem II stability/assembly factor-like uncharacterized protein
VRFFHLLVPLALVPWAQGQWIIQQSHTGADLRGIYNAGKGVVWASGTKGTILRTLDAGDAWRRCTTPPDADNLDFRGVQAWDAHTALVMSSGKGRLSRVYKTSDGCATWKIVFLNPDPDGFFDAISMSKEGTVVVGDPVDGRFEIFLASRDGEEWRRQDFKLAVPPARTGEGLFAASNSSIDAPRGHLRAFITGGKSGSALFIEHGNVFSRKMLPLSKSESGGGFSLARRANGRSETWMIVGGDYKHPDDPAGTAVVVDRAVRVPRTLPHGYRSSVAYDPSSKSWIAVGPNGTDISRDDGRNWFALHPAPGEAPDADRNWNAISLPYVVGPGGRIGKLTAAGIQKSEARIQNATHR